MTPSHRPTHLSLTTFSLTVLALALLPAAEAHAFTGRVHKEITEAVAKKLGYSAEAIAVLVKGNLDSDKKESDAPGGEWYSPPAHFDNETFSAGAARVRAKRALALESLSTCDHSVSLEAIGRALHAVQDFYAHSNFITIYSDPTKLAEIEQLTDPSPEDRSKAVSCKTGKGPLTSGYYRYTEAELRANTQLWIDVPTNRCLHDDAAAAGLHKDDTDRTGHSDAVARATRATEEFLEAIDTAVYNRYGVLMLTYIKVARDDKHCHSAHLAKQSVVHHGARTDVDRWVTPASGHWGSWRHTVACPAGSWAIGFNLKRQLSQGAGLEGADDTALNSVRLTCSDAKSTVLEPRGGPWGDWASMHSCAKGSFLTAAKVRVEAPQGEKDDTAANDVVFQCSTPTRSQNTSISIRPKDQAGEWGVEGAMVACPVDTAVCALSIRVEDPQVKEDDTAMNGLALHCCKIQ